MGRESNGNTWREVNGDGTLIVLKENLGRGPGPKAAIDEHYF